MRERVVILPIVKVKDGDVKEITFPFKVDDDFEGVIPDESLERVKETLNRLTDTQLRPQDMVRADQIQMIRQVGTGEFVVTEGNTVIYDYRKSGGQTMDEQTPVSKEPTVLPEKGTLLEQLQAKKQKRDELMVEAEKIADAIEQLNDELKGMRDSAIQEAAEKAAYFAQLAESLKAEAEE